MQNLSDLNKDNFELYAAKAYKNLQCVEYEEFRQDLNTIRLIKKTLSTKNRNIRLVVNQFTLFFNVFDTFAAVRMLLYKIPESQLQEVKTILYFLNYIDENVIPPHELSGPLLTELGDM